MPVSVHKLLKGYPAKLSGQIFEDDLILAIDEQSVQDKDHVEVIEMLRNSGEYVTLHLAKIKPGELEDHNQLADKKQDNKTDWIVSEEIPLTTASITKYKEGTNELRPNAFEVTSMDGQNSVLLFFGDSNENLQDWYESIHNNITVLNQQEVKKQNNKMIEEEEKIHHMGYVHELLAANAQCRSWDRKFVVLRSAHLEIFATAPQTVHEWMRPEKVYALTQISIELLPEKHGERPECIKLISGLGDSHIISFEHHSDIVTWTNTLQVATSLDVKKIQTISFPALWRDQNVHFTIDYTNGLLIQSQDNKNNVLWNMPFSKLRNTSDDGNRNLIMEFANSSQEVVELEDLNIVVCTIQAFLSTRVADCGDMALIVQAGLISPAQ